MPNPWDILDEEFKKFKEKRDQSVTNWQLDTCPVCHLVPFMASKDQWNHRHCENGHFWRRGEGGSYIILEGGPAQFSIQRVFYPNGLSVSIETPAD